MSRTGWREAKAQLFDALAGIGKAVASGRRVEILEVLANGERTVEGVAAAVGLSAANASQHLQVLRRAGLVVSRREGTFVRYRLASEQVAAFLRALTSLAAERLGEVGRLADAYLGAGDALEPVTREELAARLAHGEDLVVLDVRPAEEFVAGHLPRAISIPVDELERRLAELPADREIVAYCRGPYCAFAHDAVDVLRRRGFRARRLEDGFPEWVVEGYPSDGRESA